MITNRKLHLNITILALWIMLLAGCSQGSITTQPNVIVTPTDTVIAATHQVTSTPSLEITPSLTNTATIQPTATGTSTPTPDPYAGLSIESLSSRNYGGGELEIVETLAVNSYFTRTLISYPSDGLSIYGFMNVPSRGTPPYPVVIAIHGYIDPEIYLTLDYTTRYADALARNGFLVLHPNLRGYPPSDEGENLFRVGMAIDILNLIALVKDQGGQPGPLELANPEKIGVWGHSMGGGISTRVITVNKDVQAAVLYGAMSGDEQRNFERINTYFSDGDRGLEELAYPPEAFEFISPIYYYDRIQAAVSIHHGESDVDVPLPWSLESCARLEALGNSIECFTYPGQPHTFYGQGDQLFMQRMIDFYNRWLKED